MNVRQFKDALADLPDTMEVSLVIQCGKMIYCKQIEDVKTKFVEDEVLIVSEPMSTIFARALEDSVPVRDNPILEG